MKKDRRWMKSVIAASNEVQVVLPWARGTRRRPAALVSAEKPALPGRAQGVAAR